MYREVFEKLKEKLPEIFGASLEKIILYGSVARGTNAADSDIDIALFVHQYDDVMKECVLDLIVDLQLDYDVVLSLVFIDIDEFNIWQNAISFYRNVREEGITLWTAT